MIGDPPGVRPVRAEPDGEPVEWPWPPAVYASWITPELVRELTDGQPQ